MPIFRHTFSGSLGSSEEFAYSYHTSGTNTIDIELGLASDWLDLSFGAAGVLPLFSPAVAHNRLRTAELDSQGNTVTALEQELTLAGSSASPSLPFEVSVCLSLRTALAGRSFRGRIYLPPMHTASMNGTTGTFQTSVMTTLANAYQAAFNLINVPPLSPVVVSKISNGVPRPVIVATPITGIDFGNIPDAQRRRRNGQVEVRTSRPIS